MSRDEKGHRSMVRWRQSDAQKSQQAVENSRPLGEMWSDLNHRSRRGRQFNLIRRVMLFSRGVEDNWVWEEPPFFASFRTQELVCLGSRSPSLPISYVVTLSFSWYQSPQRIREVKTHGLCHWVIRRKKSLIYVWGFYQGRDKQKFIFFLFSDTWRNYFTKYSSCLLFWLRQGRWAVCFQVSICCPWQRSSHRGNISQWNRCRTYY